MRYRPDFFFSASIIFFCFPSMTFGVPEPSGSVQKTAKTEKKLNGYWWLDQKFSGSGKLFCSQRFSKNFFFKMFRIKWTFRISNWFFFFWLQRGTQKQTQIQKSGSEHEKTTIWNNARTQQATSKILSPKVRSHWGASEKVVLTWSLTCWSLSFGHFFARKNTKYRKK